MENVLLHGALGCAASAAEGTGCAGGAIGAGASAVVTPFLIAGVDSSKTALTPAQSAIVTALSALTGSLAAGGAGANGQAGATWAENESLNNDESHYQKVLAAVSAFGQGLANLVPGAQMEQQAEAAASQGNYKLAAALAVGSLVDAGVGIVTFGESSLAEQAASKTVAALDGSATVAAESTAAAETVTTATDTATTGSRGLGQYGGVFTSSTNETGGVVWTATGDISQNDFASLVNGGLYTGDVKILSGVHGLVDGSTVVDSSLYEADVARFGNVPGVTIYNFPELTPSEINGLLNGKGTTIGGFCNSSACLAPYK